MPPNTFAAVSPIYGLPLRHYLRVPASLGNTPILAIHDRWDQVIPLRTSTVARSPIVSHVNRNPLAVEL